MEVQHIELFSFQQFAHLAQVGWAERNGAHGTVKWNTKALADADHVAFGCFL